MIFSWLGGKQDRDRFARSCMSFYQFRCASTTQLLLHPTVSAPEFYRRLFSTRPSIKTLTVQAAQFTSHCEFAAIALRYLDLLPETCTVILSKYYHRGQTNPQHCIWEVSRNLCFYDYYSDTEKLYELDATGSYVIYISDKRDNFALSNLIIGVFDVVFRRQPMIQLQQLCNQSRKKRSSAYNVPLLNCRGIRYQSRPLRLCLAEKYLGEQENECHHRAKRRVVDRNSWDSDDWSDNSGDDDEESIFASDDDEGVDEWADTFDFTVESGIANGIFVHCECGECKPIRGGAMHPTVIHHHDEFNPVDDAISPQCGCLRGLITKDGVDVRCICKKLFLGRKDFELMIHAALIRPAVVRQPIYWKHVAFRTHAFFSMQNGAETEDCQV